MTGGASLSAPHRSLRDPRLAGSDGDTQQECDWLQESLDRFLDPEDAPVDLAASGDVVEFRLNTIQMRPRD